MDIQTIVSIVLVVVQVLTLGALIWYAWETCGMRKLMDQQRRDNVRPIVDMEPLGVEASSDARLIERRIAAESGTYASGLKCKLRNIGIGPALDVEIDIQLQHGGRLRKGLGTIPAGAYASDHWNLAFVEDHGSFYLTVCYKGVFGNRFESKRRVEANKKNTSFDLGPLSIDSDKRS
jgi:hypothetical protein